ncbi:hypothetical protein [Microbacterium testaceum]|uniref:hypothetical protein n=1 Tax=Microbacterium testaceum TaxID=2033 RepID=UPI0035944FFF
MEFGANAIVIGDVRIGHDSRIGPGVVVRESVRPHSTVLAQPGNVRMRLGERSGADAVASEPSSEVR